MVILMILTIVFCKRLPGRVHQSWNCIPKRRMFHTRDVWLRGQTTTGNQNVFAWQIDVETMFFSWKSHGVSPFRIIKIPIFC